MVKGLRWAAFTGHHSSDVLAGCRFGSGHQLGSDLRLATQPVRYKVAISQKSDNTGYRVKDSSIKSRIKPN